MDDQRARVEQVVISLQKFIIRSTDEKAPEYAVRVLPEAIGRYVDLIKILKTLR